MELSGIVVWPFSDHGSQREKEMHYKYKYTDHIIFTARLLTGEGDVWPSTEVPVVSQL